MNIIISSAFAKAVVDFSYALMYTPTEEKKRKLEAAVRSRI